MENRKEEMNGGGGGWMSVPAFGEWDKVGGVPDYSVDFSKIREHRKIHKSDASRASLGNDVELLAAAAGEGRGKDEERRRLPADHHHQQLTHGGDFHQDHSPTRRKKIMSYFQSCIGA